MNMGMIRLIVISAIIISVLFPLHGFCVPADVEDISNRDYLETTLKTLNEAEESIYIVMYLISFVPEEKDTPVYKLLCALSDAHNKGVDVKVILDYRSSENVEGQVSYYAYKFLKDAGIDVRFDTVGVYTHNKTIIIDEKIIVSGSANWSRSAIEKSNETNFLIESPELAKGLIKRISEIELISEREGVKEKNVLMPLRLMQKDSVFQDMVRRHDERSFDIYLLLLSRFKPDSDGKVDITYEEIRDAIGMKREGYRTMINRTLKKLQNRYKLIKIVIGYNKPVEITVLTPGAENPISTKDLRPKECLGVPLVYWLFSWDRRLTLSAKYCLLINLAEISTETQWNEWMLTREQMAEKYGVISYTISKGMAELRKYHIIDIEYGEIDKGYEQRMPAKTRYLGLYDWDEFQKALKRLEEKYGKEKVKRVRKYADIVHRAYDLEAIEDIIDFIDVYGEDEVRKAFRKVAQKNIDNPKRTFKYVIGILKNR